MRHARSTARKLKALHGKQKQINLSAKKNKKAHFSVLTHPHWPMLPKHGWLGAPVLLPSAPVLQVYLALQHEVLVCNTSSSKPLMPLFKTVQIETESFASFPKPSVSDGMFFESDSTFFDWKAVERFAGTPGIPAESHTQNGILLHGITTRLANLDRPRSTDPHHVLQVRFILQRRRDSLQASAESQALRSSARRVSARLEFSAGCRFLLSRSKSRWISTRCA